VNRRLWRLTGNAFGTERLPASERPEEHARVLSEGAAHRLSGSRSKRLISILLPVKNGAREIPELLKRALAQRCDAAVEIVAVGWIAIGEPLVGASRRTARFRAESRERGRARANRRRNRQNAYIPSRAS
jgi:hypothetical protein